MMPCNGYKAFKQLFSGRTFLMNTNGDPRNAEDLWIEKYRAALYEVPVPRTRLEKMRAIVDTAWHAVILQFDARLSAVSARGNRGGTHLLAVPTDKGSEEETVKKPTMQKPALPKAS